MKINIDIDFKLLCITMFVFLIICVVLFFIYKMIELHNRSKREKMEFDYEDSVLNAKKEIDTKIIEKNNNVKSADLFSLDTTRNTSAAPNDSSNLFNNIVPFAKFLKKHRK